MCGIVGLQLREPDLYDQLGSLVVGMLGEMGERGPDSAGIGIYGDPRHVPAGHAAVGILAPPEGLDARVTAALEARGDAAAATVVHGSQQTAVVHAAVPAEALLAAVRAAAPGAVITSWGGDLAVLKGTGSAASVAAAFDLAAATGWQAVAHTRMATESAVTPAGSHPFSVGADLCLVHNGSFSNHATIRRELQSVGVTFDSDNDSEVGARFIAHELSQGVDLTTALRRLCETFDGFYTLVVTTADRIAVVRDAIACKPAVVAEMPAWVAMASEFRAL
ncbi:MAG TPA: glutamine amidotransferase, partial [Actinomycetota bacterium]|nr:glutamine amidotransferase [Actinomycetota bacterium]